jgi:hypothetical protein
VPSDRVGTGTQDSDLSLSPGGGDGDEESLKHSSASVAEEVTLSQCAVTPVPSWEGQLFLWVTRTQRDPPRAAATLTCVLGRGSFSGAGI